MWSWLSEKSKLQMKKKKEKKEVGLRSFVSSKLCYDNTPNTDVHMISFRGDAKLTVESCPSLIDYI